MKISTWNVNGIRARHSQLEEWIARDRPDVVCLQELKAASDQMPTAIWEMQGYWCYWHGGAGYSGVGLLISQTLVPERPTFTHPPFDFEHRIVSAEVAGVTVTSTYVPNGGKDFPAKMQFLQALTEYVRVQSAEARAMVLCGDLNVSRTERDVHPKERKPRAIGQLPEEREALERLIGQGLVDVGRALDPDNDNLFTWWAPWRNLRARNIGWRLDYILANRQLAERATSCVVQKEIGTSDHAPVTATFL